MLRIKKSFYIEDSEKLMDALSEFKIQVSSPMLTVHVLDDESVVIGCAWFSIRVHECEVAEYCIEIQYSGMTKTVYRKMDDVLGSVIHQLYYAA